LLADLPHQDATEHDVPALRTSIAPEMMVQPNLPHSDDLNIDFDNIPDLPQFTNLGWRIEVTNRGRNWNWRKGARESRSGRYGGVFATLSEERKQAYEHNKQQHHARRRATAAKKKADAGTKGKTAKAQQSRRTGDPAHRAGRVSASRTEHQTSPASARVTPAA
jgi:hypothetical protein